MTLPLTTTTVTARLLGPTLDLRVKTLELTQDESWSPFIQARLTCVLDLATHVALDPRQERKIQITVVQAYGVHDKVADLTARWKNLTLANLTSAWVGQPAANITATLFHSFATPPAAWAAPIVRTFRLLLRSREIVRDAAELVLECTSDESILHDDAHVSAGPMAVGLLRVREVVEFVLGRSGRVLDNYNSTANDQLTQPSLAVWKPGQTAHDYLYNQVRRAGLKLWADASGKWNLLDRRLEVIPTAVVDGTQNMTQAKDKISRDEDWYTAAVVEYRWTDGAGNPQSAWDVYTNGYTPSRVYQLTLEYEYPGAGLAAALVSTMSKRGQVNSVDAVADWSIQPAQKVRIIIAGSPTQDDGSVAAITWNVPEDTMTVTTRDGRDY